MVMSNGQVLNNQFDFFKYHNTTRYEWFKALQGTYPQVWDEYTFYKNTNDARIFDFYTFYKYCGEYLVVTPIPFSFGLATDLIFADCGASSPDTIVYTKSIDILSNGVVLYDDVDLINPYVGTSGYYYSEIGGLGATATMQISSSGIISNYTPC